MTRVLKLTIEVANQVRDRFVAETGQRPSTIGMAEGILWVTALAPALGMTGYAMVPERGHPWSEQWPRDLDSVLVVHGGVTFAQWPWIGFDTAHEGDWWPEAFRNFTVDVFGQQYSKRAGRVWSSALVEREAAKLALQVARIESPKGMPKPSAKMSRFQHLDVAKCNTQLTEEGGRE